MTPTQLRFGHLRLDLDNLCLWSRGSRCELAPKTFDLLRYLAENPGRLLTKQELLDAVWPGQFVTEAVLKVQIGRLRKCLGEAARYVVTEPRRGYRFSAAVRGGTLPVALSSFAGRERELEKLETILAGRRLVSLVGTGGSGKTRLALELASRVDRFADDLHWIELAGVDSGDRVGTQIAFGLGVREGEEADLLQPLARAIGDRPLLLILDNCEHVIDACARWAVRLVASCPGLHLVATSREALGVDGEVVWAVEPLPVPEADPASGSLLENPSVRLFADRLASSGWPQPPGAEELLMMAQICRRLDGLPLALELAAARVPSLGIATVAARLDDAPGLLTRGRRSAPSRHRTLAAAIDWSTRLLDEADRRLFARLAVFRGGFDGDLVGRVCGARPPLGDKPLDRLAGLVERSLVVAIPRSPGMRYKLLEPVRQVAAGLLESDPADAVTTRERHARWCLDLAEECEPRLRGRERGPCLERLDQELDNLRAAMEWAEAPPDLGSVALRISTDLQWYWFHRGHWLEGKKGLAEGLASRRERDPHRLARAVEALGKIDFFRGAYREGFDGLETARQDLDRVGDAARSAEAASFQGMCALALGETPLARRLAADAVARIRPLAESWRLGLLLVNLGNVERHRKDFGAAGDCYREAVEIFDRLRDAWALGMAFRNLGMNDSCRGAIESSFEHLRQSLRHLRASGERWFVSRGLDELAANLVAQERFGEAARLFGAGEALREAVGAPLVPFYRHAYEKAVAALRQAVPADEWQTGWSDGRAMALGEALDFALDLI